MSRRYHHRIQRKPKKEPPPEPVIEKKKITLADGSVHEVDVKVYPLANAKGVTESTIHARQRSRIQGRMG